uniref:Uncharacterized protein n=1 Tax=Siphoviridae sp. ctREU2 TaxID=2826333 RepID=A0A8S5NIU0_9CAUD|nr:MAG TPA: hypothetical protein [Siphoviridae sp. ctREU2]DAJ77734.1 MAG TPA: hypothetical protein [Caudoviricetes sp.]
MTKEERIKWKKKQIRDFLKVMNLIISDEEEKEKRLNALLDDLNKLLKEED